MGNFDAEDEDDGEGPSMTNGDKCTPDTIETEHGQAEFKSVEGLMKCSVMSQADKMIDDSLTKLAQCMSIVYRQKLTSPKWNRFLGLKLRWKDKIRLNNVIWRCWHMQFEKRQRKLMFAFGNPVDLDNHRKAGSGAIMMGKYWKRKMDSVLAEYKKWRIFYKNQNDEMDFIRYNKKDKTLIRSGQDDIDLESMITDADYFVDAIFDSLESQPTQFDEDWNKSCFTNSDLIQHGLIHLQPSMEDISDLDPMLSMADWFSAKNPDVLGNKPLTPEEDMRYHGPNRSSNSTQSMIATSPAQNISTITAEMCKESPDLEASTGVWGHQTSVITSSMQVQVSTTSCVQEKDPITHRMTQAHQSKVPAKKVQTRTQAKRPLDTNSELAKLLRSDSSVPGLSKRLQDYEDIPCKRQTVLRETICNPNVLSHFILIPPPPPGSLPQPQISPGSSTSIVHKEERFSTPAEKKRKGSIKNGFDLLRSLVPALSVLPTVKISKAAQLSKAAEYMIELKEDNDAIQTEVETLQRSIAILSQDIKTLHKLLPSGGSAGLPLSDEPTPLQTMFCSHVAQCTRLNWKYWVFSRIIKQILDSYDRRVSSSSLTDLARTCSSWLDQHVTLVQLRPLVTQALKDLSVDTVILTEPHKMPLEAIHTCQQAIQTSRY